MTDVTLRYGLAELIGTFILVFVGGFAVASGQGVVVAALAHGLILIAIIYMYGHFSGAHVNPAVTAGLLVGGQIKIMDAVVHRTGTLIDTQEIFRDPSGNVLTLLG